MCIAADVHHICGPRLISAVLSTQVVMMEGMNTTGRKLMASKLYEVGCKGATTNI